MNNFLELFTSFMAGTVLALVFFGGLWVTLKSLSGSNKPILKIVTSLFLRLGLVVTLFYLLASHGGWLHLIAALNGFTVVRLLITGKTSALPRFSRGLDI